MARRASFGTLRAGSRVMKRWSLPLLLGGIVAFLFLPTFYSHVTRTFDPFAFNDDARILIWPFFRDAEPGLFRNDPFVDYFLAGLPEGYRALYHLLGHLGIAGAASEVLPYLLLLVTLGFTVVSAHRLGGLSGALSSAVLLLGGASVWDRLGGGLPRAFAFPLVAMGCYALVTGRAGWLALLVILGALFYPVVAAVLGIALFLLLVLPSRLRGTTERWSLKRRAMLLTVTFVGMVVVLSPTMLRLKPYGATITPKVLAEYPEAGPGGRLGPEQQAPFPPWYKSAGFHAKQALLGQGELLGGPAAKALRSTLRRENVLVGVVLCLAATCFGLRAYRTRRVPSEVLRLSTLLVAMIFGYVLASCVTPTLFLPERYTQYTAPLLAILLIAVGFGVTVEKSASKPPTRRRRYRDDWVKWVSFGLTACALLVLGGRGTSWIGIEVWVPPEERALYTELAALPKDCLIAGWPLGPLENVPYLSKRRVLTNYQLEMPFHRRFTDATRERLRALFRAYFATDDESLRTLVTQYGVTHVVVDPAMFVEPAPTYYRPFDVEVRRLFAAARSPARLLEIAKDPTKSRRIGRLYLVELTK